MIDVITQLSQHRSDLSNPITSITVRQLVDLIEELIIIVSYDVLISDCSAMLV
jgi:hypothetical protein